MKRWGLTLALVLSLGMNAGILAMLAVHRLGRTAPEPPQMQGMPQQHLDQLADWLRLEGDERQRFLELQQRFFRGMQENSQEIHGLHDRLRREVTSRRPDRGQVDEIVELLGARFEARERLMVDTVLDSRQLLDRRQQLQYQMFFARALRRMMAGDGQGPEGEFGPGRFGPGGRRPGRGPGGRGAGDMGPPRDGFDDREGGGRFRERPFAGSPRPEEPVPPIEPPIEPPASSEPPVF